MDTVVSLNYKDLYNAKLAVMAFDVPIISNLVRLIDP